eukprot:14717270-Alexandrium_andersonii.AAC.1
MNRAWAEPECRSPWRVPGVRVRSAARWVEGATPQGQGDRVQHPAPRHDGGSAPAHREPESRRRPRAYCPQATAGVESRAPSDQCVRPFATLVGTEQGDHRRPWNAARPDGRHHARCLGAES